ncbi:hypothetical protein [Bacillus phage SPO1L1]|nr:hypothetical protein [Bacillus phage SPO1L1]WIT26025.1 hypothetical protein [Bacillus phage SPO1L2]
MAKVKRYTVMAGDTLQGIAQTQLGDASRWTELAVLNDLRYPFISDVGESIPNTITPGSPLFLPQDMTYDDTTDNDVDSYEDELFGTDLALTTSDTNFSYMAGGDLETTLSGDLQTVSGLESLKQDLIHRLITPIGTLTYHPTYGSNFLDIVGSKMDSTWRTKASIELSRCFLCDPRVVNVMDIEVYRITTGITISCTIVTSTVAISISEQLEGDDLAN